MRMVLSWKQTALPPYDLWKNQVVCLYIRSFEVISLKSLIALRDTLSNNF